MNNTARTGRRRTQASDAAATGDLSAASRRQRSAHTSSRVRTATARGNSARTAARGARGSRSGRPASRWGGFIRYASDNRFVQTIYSITTGPRAPIFIAVVVLAVLAWMYFPVRDLYVAYRTDDILTRQLAIRQAYNDELQSRVDSLLSTEGIEDAARDLGMVKKGEKSVNIIGLDGKSDSNGDSDTDTSGETGQDGAGEDSSTDAGGSDANDEKTSDDGAESNPTTSTEVEAAEKAVANDSPWYIEFLDDIFFFNGVNGQKITSTGE